jgi:hypothetical protein
MNQENILDSLQKIIEKAELVAQFIPDEAMGDVWINDTIDSALGELDKTTSYLKDKYELDVFDFDADLSNTEFEELEDEEFLAAFDDDADVNEFEAFDFEEEDN